MRTTETSGTEGQILAANRAGWLKRFSEVRAFTEQLSAPLATEDYMIQSMPDASPAKWHLAHTTWFFETFVLQRANPAYRSPRPEYAFLFNSYYNAAGPQHGRARRGVISRPTVAETHEYRQLVDRAICAWIEKAGEPEWAELQPIVELGINHEQQHQELLLTDIKHALAQNPLYPVYKSHASPAPRLASSTSGWILIPEGIYEVGHAGPQFSYDNEGPRHRQFIESFALGTRLVTNAEYLEFVEDRGYSRPEFWLSLGWTTVAEQKWECPLYWERSNGQWHQFTLHGLERLDLSEPVCHISYFEADAFARWAGARLPDEMEWEVASQDFPISGNFVDTGAYHPRAANPGAAPDSMQQLFGDVWEWTHSAYAPYPGYRAAAGALGEYNGKFMCNQYVLRGGSCATSQNHLRRTYRNFFAPEKRWQFMGIRLAKSNV